jgi:hypothetical protein
LSRDGICGFAGLGNKDEERVREDHRMPISILACVIHLNRQPSKPFDHVFARKGSVPARAAGENTNMLETFPLSFA